MPSLPEGYPPRRAAVAPIVRWAREVWTLQTHSFEFCLSWAELRAGWEVVFSHDQHSWSTVSGPVSALRMSLYRIGWSMANFCTRTNDFGREISLTLNSPRMVQHLCKEAVFRGLERDSGDRFGVQHRLCWDVPKHLLGYSKVSNNDKGLMRAWLATASGQQPM